MTAPRPARPRPTAVLTALAVLLAGLTGVSLSLPVAASAAGAVSLTDLEVERKATPIGIDLERPRFGWVIESETRGVVQESYRVRVATEAEGLDGELVWDSGTVQDPRSFDVEYDGPALASTTGYVWDVQVVTNAGTARDASEFRTGFVDQADWDGAAWIGAPPVDPSAGWTDYTAEFEFSIQQHALGVFIRANGLNNALMYQVSTTGSTPTLRPHTRVNGGYALLQEVPISSISKADLLTGKHTLTMTVSPGADNTRVRVVTLLDGTQIDTREVTGAAAMQRGVVGFRSNTHAGTNEQFTVFGATVTRADGTVLLDTDFSDGNPFEGGTLVGQELRFTSSTETLLKGPDQPAPLMRKEFSVSQPVAHATHYVAAGGYADVTLNGERISDDTLSPGFTDYDDTVQYVGTDVTDQVMQGDNVLGMELGRGFYGMLGGNVWNWQSPPWHGEPRARGVLVIEYADGTTERVVTDDSWTTRGGPTRLDDLYAGERYDARYEVDDWDTAAYDDSDWDAAAVVDAPKGELVNQRQQPIRVTRELKPVGITEPVDGVYVVKFPNVIAGRTKVTVQGPEGTTIKTAHAEKLRADGRVNLDNNGGFQLGFQTDSFTLAGTGAPETFEPRFSYKGFQYVEVTGWPGDQAPPLSAFTAEWLHTDAEQTGDFESSSDIMNRTHDIVVNTLYNNIHGIPTDTPMFEKNGWTGDAAVGAEMFMMNLDTHELFAKWMRDLDETREGNGAPMVIAPSSGNWGVWGPSQPWHAAYVMTPWWLYQYGGDERVMTELYDNMKKYVDLEYGRRQPDGLVISNRLGDWVSPEASPGGGHAPGEDQRVEGSAYLYLMLDSMARTARHLGKTADATEFTTRAGVVKDAFNAAYLDGDRYRGAGQDGNRFRQVHSVLALAFGLTPDEETEEAVAARLAADVEQRGYHLDTGTLGTKYLLPVLTEHGYADVAVRLAEQTTYPSWGFKLANGATTVWEHWSLESRSLGHYFLGTVDDWFYHYAAGIRPSVDEGFRRVTIEPATTEQMDSAKATVATPYGPVTSDWRTRGRALELKARVPVGSTATVRLPLGEATSVEEVLEGGAPVTDVDGVEGVEIIDGVAVVTVGSGSYDFRVQPDADPERDLWLTLAPLTEPVVRGQQATGSIAVTNWGGAPVTGLRATVDAGDLTITGDLQVAELAPAASTELRFDAAVPHDARLGAREVTVVLTFASGGQDYEVTETTTWAEIVAGVAVDGVSGSVTDPRGKLVPVDVVLRNEGTQAQTGQVRATVPAGWPTPPTGPPLTLEPGETRTVTTRLRVPHRIVEGDQQVGAQLVQGDQVLARGRGTLTVALTTPPTTFTDHVDFGDPTSENAHDLQAHPRSGINSEAGLTRRYANSLYPGSWFSAELDVPKGEPFGIRMRETFDGARTKEMNLYVDDVPVGRYTVERAQGGLGWLAHDLLVDSPAALAATADGTARIKIEFPTDATDYDPSVADLWVVPGVTKDTAAPVVGARTRGTAGSGDWFTSPVQVEIDAIDDDDEQPRVEVQDGAGWASYVAPVELADDGEHTVTYRAADASGNVTEPASVDVKVDQTAPVTVSEVVAPATAAAAAQVRLTATDATSGVATTMVKVDAGEWQPATGPVTLPSRGAHAVAWFSVDVAGNAEAVRHAQVATLPTDGGQQQLVALAPPQVSGTAEIGRKLRATGGSWSRADVTVAHQWLRDGQPIPGATESTYRVVKRDRRSRLSVRVTATAGTLRAESSSLRTDRVRKATTKVGVRVLDKKVTGRSVRLRIDLSAAGVKPRGKVVVRVGGKRVARVKARGTTTVRVPIGRGATHRVTVVYQGSQRAARATAKVVVRRR
ncbi:family 78 glycoside hydrolase catalytic domain [Nocardioides hwasunensis]|uniref:alpha-L-rhamnosidase n=1 Tax=Nocardioides hwasunensis TaxID=397258 RepID=A0ABR8MJ95_9ACTN|nr:family 78 glycoside hydrolase catalytic domain [Nocardioides hwasunensis]MBD3915141.1 family 78 glycoside hydrolase catalytic domain [Nocardioides hwasunensis]